MKVRAASVLTVAFVSAQTNKNGKGKPAIESVYGATYNIQIHIRDNGIVVSAITVTLIFASQQERYGEHDR